MVNAAALRRDAEAARLVLAETRRTHPHVAAELLRVLTAGRHRGPAGGARRTLASNFGSRLFYKTPIYFETSKSYNLSVLRVVDMKQGTLFHAYVKVELQSRFPNVWVWKIRRNDNDLVVEQALQGFPSAEPAWREGHRMLTSLEAQHPARPNLLKIAA